MKGFFTQGICILLDHEFSLDEIERCLAGYNGLERKPAAPHWSHGGPAIVIPYRPEVRGIVLVDVVGRRWPDAMGDPKTDAMLFGAWGMGFFGPFAFPGNLARAVQQPCGLPEAAATVARHTAFLRIRLSYAFGAQQDDLVIPQDYKPQPKLDFLTQIALKLCAVPGALCYFNPNGEYLCDYNTLKQSWDRYATGGLRPLDVWSNRRLFNLSDVGGWALMDTIGMQQLDVIDHEACFRKDRYNPNDIARYLLNLSEYTLSSGHVINDGDTTDGPGRSRWQAQHYKKSLTDPPRPTLRWLPLDGTKAPEVFLRKEEM